MNIFGVQIKPLNREQVRTQISSALEGNTVAIHAITANPEMLVAARTDKHLLAAMQRSPLIVSDGVGLSMVGMLFYGESLPRVTGEEVLNDIASLIAKKQGTLVLLGGDPGDAEEAARVFAERYPGLVCEGIHGGDITHGEDGGWLMEAGLMDHIRALAPMGIAVALGHGKQEAWIADHLQRLPSVRVGIGVGGVFAFLSGGIRRAPKEWRDLGVEWMWRLMQEPARIGRIFTAVIIFPILAFYDRLTRH